MESKTGATIVGGFLFAALLAGCGSASPGNSRPFSAPALTVGRATPLEADWRKTGIPKNFEMVLGAVVKLLPDDNNGLPHQRFILRVEDPFPGRILEVDHNVSMAPPVEPLSVGEPLLVRGVIYSGSKEGIHWTHHAAKPGDAGFIQTQDGAVFE
jgi:hypothetical protein